MIVQEDVPYTKEEVKAMVKTIHDLREQLKRLGWHPVTEPPKEGDEVIIITLGGAAAARAIYLNGIYYSVVINKKAYYPSVEYWCYPPKKEE